MKIPFTIEPTGQNSAQVVCKNYEHNGIRFLKLRCPIEWKSDADKPKLISLAEEMITAHIKKTFTE